MSQPSQLSLDLTVEQTFVAVSKEGQALFSGPRETVNAAASAYAKEHKVSVQVMTNADFAKLPQLTLERKHRKYVRELNNQFTAKLNDAGAKAVNRMAKLIAKPDFVPTGEQIQHAISTLNSAGTYKRSDVLSKANAGMPLSVGQIKYLLCETARVDAIAKAAKKFGPALQAATELPF